MSNSGEYREPDEAPGKGAWQDLTRPGSSRIPQGSVRGGNAPGTGGDAFGALSRGGVIGVASDGLRWTPDRGQGYYDVPIIKHSEWTWMVPTYFTMGGIAGASYVLGRLADQLGGESLRPLARVATFVSAASLATAPPLLILDLGDPKRFHHMLRVFKPISPMNVGSWTLTGFGGAIAAAFLKETLGKGKGWKALMIPVDLAGIPLGLMMTGYTGVLISTTSTPIWAQNPWIGPLFTASAFELALSVISLGIDLSGHSDSQASKALHPIKLVARLITAGALGGYLASAGRLARPLTSGKYSPHIWCGAVGGGLVISGALEVMAQRRSKNGQKRASKNLKLAGSALGIAGGFLLKWAICSAGHVSGRDAEASRLASRKSR